MSTKKSQSPLLAAIERQDPDAVTAALEAGARPNETQDEWGNTALGLATDKARWGETEPGLEVLRRLLAAGADPNLTGQYQTPPLQSAAYRGDDAIARLLVEHGADVTAVESTGDNHSVLLCAASGGLLWLVERSLEAGADVTHRSAQGHTVMHYAVSLESYIDGKQERFEAVAERLRVAGAALELVNNEWGAPLHWAAGRSDNLDGVRWLLARGCKIDVATPKGVQPIHAAAKMGRGAIIDALVEAGADVNAKDAEGQTPLHYACERPASAGDAVARLLAAGADVNARAQGRSPLAVAVATKKSGAKLKGDEAAVYQRLLAAGADPNVKTKSGTTPLHLFARVGDASLLRQAIERGAAIETGNKYSWTALHLACTRAEPDCARALLDAGASRAAKTRRSRKLKKQTFPAGTTPRIVAEKLGGAAVAALLQ